MGCELRTPDSGLLTPDSGLRTNYSFNKEAGLDSHSYLFGRSVVVSKRCIQ